ncbi:MAG: DUF4922 domain-containing protein, partial [Bacteroidales bacterium]|nr:DUF4922 domain-containing protein [Bacteroidales bacterium]
MKLPIDKFFKDQISRWPLACENYRALKTARTKTAIIGGLNVAFQCNPARIISTAAKTDRATLKKRPCFLCEENRPKEQSFLPFEGRKGKKYDILVNPYPIFDRHLVIAYHKHEPQDIAMKYVDILDLSQSAPEFVFFYNGPKCGASAPDHHHFQGAPVGSMAIEPDVRNLIDSDDDKVLRPVTKILDAKLFEYKKYLRGVFVIRSRTVKSSAKLFYRLLDCAPFSEDGREPLFNLLTFVHKGEYISIIIFRNKHRSSHYFEPAGSPKHLTMSPGCADMMGTLIMPVEEEWENLNLNNIEEMLSEVTLSEAKVRKICERLTRGQKLAHIGFFEGKELEFEVHSDGAGRRKAYFDSDKVRYGDVLYDELYFDARNPDTMFAEESFTVYNLPHIGENEGNVIGHFAGALKIVASGGRLLAININGVEDYLLSVLTDDDLLLEELR